MHLDTLAGLAGETGDAEARGRRAVLLPASRGRRPEGNSLLPPPPKQTVRKITLLDLHNSAVGPGTRLALTVLVVLRDSVFRLAWGSTGVNVFVAEFNTRPKNPRLKEARWPFTGANQRRTVPQCRALYFSYGLAETCRQGLGADSLNTSSVPVIRICTIVALRVTYGSAGASILTASHRFTRIECRAAGCGQYRLVFFLSTAP